MQGVPEYVSLIQNKQAHTAALRRLKTAFSAAVRCQREFSSLVESNPAGVGKSCHDMVCNVVYIASILIFEQPWFFVPL